MPSIEFYVPSFLMIREFIEFSEFFEKTEMIEAW